MPCPRPHQIKIDSHYIPMEPAAMPLARSTFSLSDETKKIQVSHLQKDGADISELFDSNMGTNQLKYCCGGGCVSIQKSITGNSRQVIPPDNMAYRSLHLEITSIPIKLSGVPELPTKTVSILPINHDSPLAHVESSKMLQNSIDLKDLNLNSTSRAATAPHSTSAESHGTFSYPPIYSKIDTTTHPPNFVQPHPPHHVFSAPISSARELTRPGAEKRTFHFDLDVTDYPIETGVDFKVGGAIGVCAPNEPDIVEGLFDLLCIPKYLRSRPILLKTTSGRWPTVWGDDQPRELVTTRRDILTWCSDLQSQPPTKSLLRLLAEFASTDSEKKILLYLTSTEGQSAFCDLRTRSCVTILQLLHAFPSSKPPLDALLSNLQQLMPRFYSLSNDPHDSCAPSTGCKRLIEIAVTVQGHLNWDGSYRTGVGSGFLERQAKKFIDAEKNGTIPDLRVPIFKGLMANPLANEFASDGPMLLIGAGVGIAPFRGFVQRRLRRANCANKVWVLQGIRDSLLDELYQGEWGLYENEVKKVAQSRPGSGKSKYVQDEVRSQADLVWFVINSLNGRIFVCGSSSGMSEGVEKALVDVSMKKGNLDEGNARLFWKLKKDNGQLVTETW